jgi:hypothetical protein
VGICLRFVSGRQQLSAPLAICSQLQLVSSVMVRYTLEQRVFLYDTYVKYGSIRKCQRKFRRKFRDDSSPSRQTIHSFVNNHRTTGLLINTKQKLKRRVLTAEKLNDIGHRLNIYLENH